MDTFLGKCTFPPLVEGLMRMDKAHWPRCFLWHGWIPVFSGVNGACPWDADASQGAGNMVENALGH